MRKLRRMEASRNGWKKKAKERATEIRETRKARKKEREKNKLLLVKIDQLELELKKKIEFTTAEVIPPQRSKMEIRVLTVSMVFFGVISFRSIPRILQMFFQPKEWIPHFTSVINWSLRIGLALLNNISPINEPWIAIMDHTINIGIKKVLVVLRVKFSALTKRGSAILLEDAECIGLKVHDVTNGNVIASDLEEIFLKSGNPVAIIKDKGSDLKNGVNIWMQKTKQDKIEMIDDVGHVFANALKHQFSNSVIFNKFLNIINHCSKKLRQTKLAFLIPPKIRTKGRYQGILRLANWALEILDFLGKTNKDKEFAKLRTVLAGLVFVKPIILIFAKSVITSSNILKILKNEGLNENTLKKSLIIAETMDDKSSVKKKIIAWLNKHYEICKKLKLKNSSLIVSSDIIESLFGKFKHIQDRSSTKDMNRSVLLIPVFCGVQNTEIFNEMLLNTGHIDIEIWDKKNIPYTQNRLRRKILTEKGNLEEPKSGNFHAEVA